MIKRLQKKKKPNGLLAAHTQNQEVIMRKMKLLLTFVLLSASAVMSGCKVTAISNATSGGGDRGGPSGPYTTSHVDSVRISAPDGRVCVNQNVQLVATVYPLTTNPAGSWSGGGANASVTSTGVASGLKAGSQSVTFRHAGTNRAFTNSVSVADCGGGTPDYSGVTITLVPVGDCKLLVGQSFKLTPVISPASTPSGGTWKSSNPGVAAVDATGNIIAIAPGTTEFTFTLSVNTSKVGRMTCTVSAATGTGGGMTLSFTPATGSGYAGTTLQLVPRVTGTTNTTVLWFSTDPSRVGVGLRTGLVSYIFPGSAIICAQLEANAAVKFCGTFTTLGSNMMNSSLSEFATEFNHTRFGDFPRGDGQGGYVSGVGITISQ